MIDNQILSQIACLSQSTFQKTVKTFQKQLTKHLLGVDH